MKRQETVGMQTANEARRKRVLGRRKRGIGDELTEWRNKGTTEEEGCLMKGREWRKRRTEKTEGSLEKKKENKRGEREA